MGTDAEQDAWLVHNLFCCQLVVRMPGGQPSPAGLLSFNFAFVLLHCLAHMTVVCGGVFAMAQDSSVKSTMCNHRFHIFKYSVMCQVLFGAAFVTYFVAKSVEFVRTRAIMLAIVHAAFGVWGGLTIFKYLDPDCRSGFEDHFPAIWAYWRGCVYANITYGALYLFHEIIWPNFSIVDWTVVPVAAIPNLMPTYSNAVRNGTKSDTALPHSFPANIHQDLEAEYQKIITGVPGYAGPVPAPIGAFSTT